MKLPKAPSRTTPNFAFSTFQRAINEGFGRRKFGKNEMHQVLEFFGNEHPQCVYCGSTEVKRWDHLISISNGGETVLGNVVPACQVCDDSKRDVDYKEWMQSNVERSPKTRGVKNLSQRIDAIENYMKRFRYDHRSLPQRLSQTEQAKLGALQSKIEGLKKEVESFIREFRREHELK